VGILSKRKFTAQDTARINLQLNALLAEQRRAAQNRTVETRYDFVRKVYVSTDVK
jgi:hypothetical protein